MKKIVEVQTGEVKLGTADSILKSEGIGSCVVIAAYDAKKKLGAIAHVMLPATSKKDNDYEPNTRYADDAINALLADMGRAGSTVEDIEVCLAGGANVLKRDDDAISNDNSDSVIKLLREKAINVVAKSLGGTERRSVSLDVETGTVTCAEGDEKEKVLWKAAEKRNEFSPRVPGGSLTKQDTNEPQNKNTHREVSKEASGMEPVAGDKKRILELEASQRAYLNIMQDLEKKKKELEDVQKAYLNIMQDMEKKNKELRESQKASLNMMQDLAVAKKKTEELNSTLEQKVEEATRELKESTVQLIQSEKLSALGELTAGVAHELNQPLNVIKIIAQSILRDLSRNDIDQKALENDLKDVVLQINRMAAIITHMRIFTRNTVGDMLQATDINTIIENALKFHEQQLANHNIILKKEFENTIPKILGDPIRLEQVILNFISNAKDALEKQKNKELIIKTSANDKKQVIIEFKDNGFGISEEIQKKIFNPFFTTKEVGKGTGLGLSVAKKIIEEHKGTVEVESKVGAGTIFRIKLPEI